jgi:hypothetical protein
MKKVILLFGFISILFSCTNDQEKRSVDSLQRMEWLLGEWKSMDGDFVSTEHWKRVSQDLYSGVSMTTKGADTVFHEHITLQRTGEDIFYIVKVEGQNNEQPVPFKFIGTRDGEFTFENKEHDFPQQIIYKNPQPDMLVARISGVREGKTLSEDFSFVRIK